MTNNEEQSAEQKRNFTLYHTTCDATGKRRTVHLGVAADVNTEAPACKACRFFALNAGGEILCIRKAAFTQYDPVMGKLTAGGPKLYCVDERKPEGFLVRMGVCRAKCGPSARFFEPYVPETEEP